MRLFSRCKSRSDLRLKPRQLAKKRRVPSLFCFTNDK
nr:MAG TPA: hypothetical protein [Caudoviricetes sp.]